MGKSMRVARRIAYLGMMVLILHLGAGFRHLSAQEEPTPLDQGLEAFENKDYEKAVGHFRAWLDAHPDETGILLPLAEALEGLGRSDEALGYYMVIAALPERKGDREWMLLQQNAMRKVRTMDDQSRALEQIRRRVEHSLDTLAREAARRQQNDILLECTRMLAAMNPRDVAKWSEYHRAARLAKTPALPEPPRGFQSMLNFYDFEGWGTSGGSWFYKDGILNGTWGGMTYEAAKPTNYTIRIEYQAPGTDRQGYRAPTIGLHREGWRGATVHLAGEFVGTVQRTDPNPRFGHTKDPQNPRDPPTVYLNNPAPFQEGEWNTMEIRVRGLSVQVDLNGQRVYEDQNSNWHGWATRGRSREFPGSITMDAGSHLQVRLMLIRPN